LVSGYNAVMNQSLQRTMRSTYLANPNLCRNCRSPILPKPGQKLNQARVKLYCGLACAAEDRIRNGTCGRAPRVDISGACESCKGRVEFKRSPLGRIIKRRFCASCLLLIRSRGQLLSERTKGELFANRANWQSARSAIRRHAYLVFSAAKKKLECHVCGYSVHSEIAHKRGVSDFPPEATIAEINAIENLVALCPNHHWELDHSLLVLE
jgi:hypothetical protein